MPRVLQYRLWSFMFGDTKYNRLSPKIEDSLIYIMKWNDGEPTKFGPIFTK